MQNEISSGRNLQKEQHRGLRLYHLQICSQENRHAHQKQYETFGVERATIKSDQRTSREG